MMAKHYYDPATILFYLTFILFGITVAGFYLMPQLLIIRIFWHITGIISIITCCVSAYLLCDNIQN